MTTPSDAGRTLQLQRWAKAPLVDQVCVVCGTAFQAKHKDARYCSHSCRQIAYQRREAVKKRERKERQ